MRKPTNSAAEQIVSMRSINDDIDTQIASLRATQQRNLDTIAAFDEIATWEEVEEPVVVEETAIEPAITDPEVPSGDVIIIGEPPVIVDGEFAPAPDVPVVETPLQAAPRAAKKTK